MFWNESSPLRLLLPQKIQWKGLVNQYKHTYMQSFPHNFRFTFQNTFHTIFPFKANTNTIILNVNLWHDDKFQKYYSSSFQMSSRKRTKRSLADTVQMLSTDVKKVSKEESVSPPPSSFLQPTPFTLPQVPVPFSNIQRWLGAPFPNPMYLNALMFQQPKSSEEQLAALMKMWVVLFCSTSFLSPTYGPRNMEAGHIAVSVGTSRWLTLPFCFQLLPPGATIVIATQLFHHPIHLIPETNNYALW